MRAWVRNCKWRTGVAATVRVQPGLSDQHMLPTLADLFVVNIHRTQAKCGSWLILCNCRLFTLVVVATSVAFSRPSVSASASSLDLRKPVSWQREVQHARTHVYLVVVQIVCLHAHPSLNRLQTSCAPASSHNVCRKRIEHFALLRRQCQLMTAANKRLKKSWMPSTVQRCCWRRLVQDRTCVLRVQLPNNHLVCTVDRL